MSDEDRLDVVLLWHMHQPQYADAPDRCNHLPWAYLRTIEDCVDMAAHLEAVPAARVVVNFAPTLLQQIDDYARMVRDYLGGGAAIRDLLLAALAAPELPADPAHRTRPVAGSWVHGTLSTGVGEQDRNRGWRMLIEAKRAFDDQVAHGRLDEPALGQAQQQLGICDGADWVWWFGPANPTESVRDFDALYRHHLANLYRLIDETAPTHLDSPFTFGGGAPAAGGVMRPGIHS